MLSKNSSLCLMCWTARRTKKISSGTRKTYCWEHTEIQSLYVTCSPTESHFFFALIQASVSVWQGGFKWHFKDKLKQTASAKRNKIAIECSCVWDPALTRCTVAILCLITARQRAWVDILTNDYDFVCKSRVLDKWKAPDIIIADDHHQYGWMLALNVVSH